MAYARLTQVSGSSVSVSSSSGAAATQSSQNHSSSPSPDGAGPRMQQLWNHRGTCCRRTASTQTRWLPAGAGGVEAPRSRRSHRSTPPPPPRRPSPPHHQRQGKNSCWPPECAPHVGRAHARVIESITPCERGAATGRCGRAAGSGGVRWRPDLTLHTLRPLYGVGSGVRRAGRQRGGCSLQNPRFGGLRGHQTHRPDG